MPPSFFAKMAEKTQPLKDAPRNIQVTMIATVVSLVISLIVLAVVLTKGGK